MRDDAIRSRRKGPPKKRRIRIWRLFWKRPKRLTEHWRPVTRAECVLVPRPCPYVGCKYNLYLTVGPGGSIRQVGEIEPWDMKHSCVLDIADIGGITQDAAAEAMNLTRYGLQLLEKRALAKVTGTDPTGGGV